MMMGDDRRTAIGMSLSLTHESRLLIEVPLSGWPSATKRSAFGFGYAPQDRDLITRTSCGARRNVSNRIDALFVMTMESWNFAVGPDGMVYHDRFPFDRERIKACSKKCLKPLDP